MYKIMKKLYKIRLQRDFFFKLATNDRSDKMFLFTLKFRPQGDVSPCPGAIYMYKIMRKKLYKIRLQRDVFESCNKWTLNEVTRGFCWLQNFVPWGWLPLTCGYIHVLNHEKMCIKSEVEEILFKLATNDHSDEAFLLTSKFWPLMGCQPHTLGLCLNFFS